MGTTYRSRATLSMCAALAAASASLTACAGERAHSEHAEDQIVTLAVDGKSNEQVTLAAAGTFVAAVWSASASGTSDVYAAVSHDGGASFNAPVRVNATAGDARTSGEQPPQVALMPTSGPTPQIAVVWTSKRVEGTRLLVARSIDGGASFGATEVIRGSEAAGNRGWQSIAVDATGRVLVAWLDHRNTVGAPAAMHHHDSVTRGAVPAARPDPVERAERSQLLFATVGDSASPRAITSGVCYCCKTALTTGAHGTVFAAWRHVFPGNQRDIGFAVSHNGGATFAEPVRVSEDHWAFDGCPENGPAIAVDDAQRVHVAWLTPLDGKLDAPLALYFATSRDARAFTPRVRVPTRGAAAHVRMATAPDGSILLTWEERVQTGTAVKLVRATVNADGAPRFVPIDLSGADAAMYPALAVTSDGVAIAWVRRTAGGTVIDVVRVRGSSTGVDTRH